jgi:hypothetical protein
MENIRFTKTVRSAEEAKNINLAYWYNQLAKQEQQNSKYDYYTEITVSLHKTMDFSRYCREN